jgi:hypothetical protein
MKFKCGICKRRIRNGVTFWYYPQHFSKTLCRVTAKGRNICCTCHKARKRKNPDALSCISLTGKKLEAYEKSEVSAAYMIEHRTKTTPAMAQTEGGHYDRKNQKSRYNR